MAYTNPPYGKTTVQDANTVPFFVSIRSAIPSQASSAIGHEGQESGEIFSNIQRNTIRLVFMVRGTPEEVKDSDLFAGMAIGDPHPLIDQGGPYSSTYLIDMRVVYESHGAADDDATNFAQAWSRATLTYQQRQCLHKPATSTRSALVVYNAWYREISSGGDVEPILGTLDTVPVLRPVSVRSLRWDRVWLTTEIIESIKDALGKTNAEAIWGGEAEEWLFDGAAWNLLHEKDPDNTDEDGWYEVTLTFRSDPHRKHQWWTPVLAGEKQGFRPIKTATSMAAAHVKKSLYTTSGTSFNELVTGPDAIAACVPSLPSG